MLATELPMYGKSVRTHPVMYGPPDPRAFYFARTLNLFISPEDALTNSSKMGFKGAVHHSRSNLAKESVFSRSIFRALQGYRWNSTQRLQHTFKVLVFFERAISTTCNAASSTGPVVVNVDTAGRKSHRRCVSISGWRLNQM